jgi:hypothetical protein
MELTSLAPLTTSLHSPRAPLDGSRDKTLRQHAMSKETLNTFRLLLPGLMLYMLLLPLVKGSLNPTVIIANLGTIEDLFYLIAAFCLGGLYYAFDIRGRLHRPELNYIHYNIQRKLLAPFRNDETIAHAQDRLRKGQTLWISSTPWWTMMNP